MFQHAQAISNSSFLSSGSTIYIKKTSEGINTKAFKK